MKVCVSVDMDNYREYRLLVDPDGEDVGASFYDDAVPRFLDAFDRHGIRGTFFLVGCDIQVASHRRAARQIRDRGHEVGNHSWSHPYNLRKLRRAQKQTEIARAEGAIADAVGERPVGFRCPSGELDAEVLELLDERGYLYDSSFFPTPFMWLFMVYGRLFIRHESYQLGKLTAAFAPRRPYLPMSRCIHRERALEEDGPQVVEIPFSVTPWLGIPFYGTLFRVFPPSFFTTAVRWHGRNAVLLQMLFHLIDLVELGDSSLGEALRRMPGLGVPFDRRADFVDRALATLKALGEPVCLRDVAREFRVRRGLPVPGAAPALG